jgi:hypothetical protein
MDPRFVQKEKINDGNEYLTYFGDESFINECVLKWEAEVPLRKAKAGAFGGFYTITLNNGTKYGVKKAEFSGAKDNEYTRKMLRDELAHAITTTQQIPDMVSNLRGALYRHNNTLKISKIYLIFEWLPGSSLREYIQDVSHAYLESTNLYPTIYCSIKTAQDALNGIGYVHRDIKPDNIFIEVDKENRFIRARLIDLGLVIRAGKASPPAGTPIYMPAHLIGPNGIPKPNQYTPKPSNNSHSVNIIWSKDFNQGALPTPKCPASCPKVQAPPAAPGGLALGAPGVIHTPPPAGVGFGFGSPAAGFGFGSPVPAAPAARANLGLFGSPAPAAPAAGFPFGSPAPRANVGLFGSPAPAAAAGIGFGPRGRAAFGSPAGFGHMARPPPHNTNDAMGRHLSGGIRYTKKKRSPVYRTKKRSNKKRTTIKRRY